LSLIHTQLKNPTQDLYLSGRENIYSEVENYLSENGLFPSGISMARYLTNGQYYHSHSFYLETLLVFGYIITYILILVLIMRFIYIFKSEKSKDDIYKIEILVLLLISFIVRSITGTYFISDILFLTGLSIVVSKINKPKKVFD